jgi:uncharacterized protein DUF3298
MRTMRGGRGWPLGWCVLLAAGAAWSANPWADATASPGASPASTPSAMASPASTAAATPKIVEASLHDAKPEIRATAAITYPQFEGMADERVQLAVNERLAADARKAASDWFAEVTANPFEPLPGTDPKDPINTNSLDERFEQVMLDGRLASLRIFKTFFLSGGAHSVTTVETYNIDLRKGRFFELRDLFKPGSDYLGFLSQISRKLLEIQKVGVEQQRIEGTTPEAENFAAWVVVPEGIEITFGPYQVASFADGLPRILILRQAMGDLIADDEPLGYSEE